MSNFLIRNLRGLQDYLYRRFTKPERDEIVLSLVLQTARMGMQKGEHVEFAPLPGCCGPFRLEGAFLPVFTYRVFEKKLMEFLKVTVEVSKPDRIHFTVAVDSKGTQDPVNHGMVVESKPEYEEPFHRLSLYLFDYFPYWRKTE